MTNQPRLVFATDILKILSFSESLGFIVHIFVKLFQLGGEEVRQPFLDTIVTESQQQFGSPTQSFTVSQLPYGCHGDANISLAFLTTSLVLLVYSMVIFMSSEMSKVKLRGCLDLC